MHQLKGLDQIDGKIIRLLTENARMSYVDMAGEVNLSRSAVKMRVEALEKEGIIEKYTLIVNPEKIGKTVSVYCDIEVRPEGLNQVIEKLVKLEAVTDLYQMTGSSRLHMHAVLTSNEELEDFVRRELYALPDILKVDLHIIVSRLKTRKGIRI